MPRQKRVKFWQTEKFKNLKKIWEEKLLQSGFEDVEFNGRLKQNASNCYRTKAVAVIENKQAYYDALSQRFHKFEHKFQDPVDKYVMQRRAEGAKLVSIRHELKQMGEKSGRETIRLIVKRYESRWKIKKKA